MVPRDCLYKKTVSLLAQPGVRKKQFKNIFWFYAEKMYPVCKRTESEPEIVFFISTNSRG